MSNYYLSKGGHTMPEDGRCAMEWVSYLAGEPHTDQPVCVSQVLRTYCIDLNDALPDEKRQRLRPYLARTIGTAGDGLDEQRAWQCMDWLVREYAPAWLELVPSLAGHAERLRALPPILAVQNATRVMGSLDAARSAARAAARSAPWDAATDAVRRAAWRAAAGDAAWTATATAAAGAARGAAAAAEGAARGAAAAAEGAAAAALNTAPAVAEAAGSGALAPTIGTLQDSAILLLDRMLPTEVIEVPAACDWREVVMA